MKRYGVFNDAGCIDGPFYDMADAEQASADSSDEFARVEEMCGDHDEQPKSGCEECFEEESE